MSDERTDPSKPTYNKALDTWASQRILNIIDLASIAIEGNNFPLAIDKITDAWQVLPNNIKDNFKSPNSEIYHALKQVPTMESLISSPHFNDEDEIETYRFRMAANIIKNLINDYKEKFIRQMDDSGLYLSQRKTKWGKRNWPKLTGGDPDSRTTTNF